MEKGKYIYMTCPKCGGKLKLAAPGHPTQMIFGCPHCQSKLKLVYTGEEKVG